MPSGYQVPEDYQKRLKRNRLWEILASAGAGMGTGRMGSAMLAGVANANRNYDQGIAEFLDDQMRREQEERYRQREERILAREEEQERLRQEARSAEDQSLEALASRIGSLAYGDESAEAQGVAMLGTRDVGGLSRLLGSLEERRKLQALGINPDDPASRQRYLIKQGVDAPPGGMPEPTIRQAATGEMVQLGPDGTWQRMGGYNPQTPRQWQMEPDEPKLDPLAKKVRDQVQDMVLRGEITAAAAPAEMQRRYRELSAVEENLGAGLGDAPVDIEALSLISGNRRVQVAPRQRVAGAGGPGGGGKYEPLLAAALAKYPQASTQFNIEAAKKAGYSDEEIAREIERLFGRGGGM